MEIGQRIRLEREKRGISARELGRRAGLSSSTVCLLENGGRPDPAISTVTAIATALGVGVDTLLPEPSSKDEDFDAA